MLQYKKETPKMLPEQPFPRTIEARKIAEMVDSMDEKDRFAVLKICQYIFEDSNRTTGENPKAGL